MTNETKMPVRTGISLDPDNLEYLESIAQNERIQSYKVSRSRIINVIIGQHRKHNLADQLFLDL
jgi:hypothetical protein